MPDIQFDIKKIKLIVGLGNIGKNYERTRHNAGFTFLDYLASQDFTEQSKFESLISKTYFDDHTVLLAKPTTMMNLSGAAVIKIATYFEIAREEILIAFDDLDLELGNNKLQFAKSPKVHNGISDIQRKLSSKNFWSYRIGVDARTRENRKFIAPNKYVLSRFSKNEYEILEKSFDHFDLKIKGQ